MCIRDRSWVKDDVTYDFVKTDGVWAKADEAIFPVDQDALNALAEDLLDLTATRKLEDVTSCLLYTSRG